MALRYRKTKDGEWVAYGPAAELRPGMVAVTKKDGTAKEEAVLRVGKPFTVDGVAMAYGYLAPDPEHACAQCGRAAGTIHRTDSSGIPGKVCGRCNKEPWYCLSFA